MVEVDTQQITGKFARCKNDLNSGAKALRPTKISKRWAGGLSPTSSSQSIIAG